MSELLHVFKADEWTAKRHNVAKDKWYFWDLNFRTIMSAGYATFEEAVADFKAYYNQNYMCPGGHCGE